MGIHVAVVSVHREERERRAVSGRRAPRRGASGARAGRRGRPGGAGLDDGRRRGVVDHADAERVAGEDAEDLARVDGAGVGGGETCDDLAVGGAIHLALAEEDAVATLDAKRARATRGRDVDARTVAPKARVESSGRLRRAWD